LPNLANARPSTHRPFPLVELQVFIKSTNWWWKNHRMSTTFLTWFKKLHRIIWCLTIVPSTISISGWKYFDGFDWHPIVGHRRSNIPFGKTKIFAISSDSTIDCRRFLLVNFNTWKIFDISLLIWIVDIQIETIWTIDSPNFSQLYRRILTVDFIHFKNSQNESWSLICSTFKMAKTLRIFKFIKVNINRRFTKLPATLQRPLKCEIQPFWVEFGSATLVISSIEPLKHILLL